MPEGKFGEPRTLAICIITLRDVVRLCEELLGRALERSGSNDRRPHPFNLGDSITWVVKGVARSTRGSEIGEAHPVDADVADG
jgi:hypothetical protein